MLAGRLPSSRHCGSTTFAQLIMKSTKHRTTRLKISRENPVFNIIVFKDVETNPGPSKPENLELPPTLYSPCLHQHTRLYSNEALLSLRRYTTSINLSPDLLQKLKDLNILQFRGIRAGKQSKNRKKQSYQRAKNMKEYIKVRITTRQPSSIASLQRGRSQFVIKRVPYAKSYEVPSILSTNIRSLSNKVDELNEVATLNKSDIINVRITESW